MWKGEGSGGDEVREVFRGQVMQDLVRILAFSEDMGSQQNVLWSEMISYML